MDLEEIQKKLDNEPGLRLRGFKKKIIKDIKLEGFIDLFFTKYNNEYETIYIVAKREQTEPGKRRSLSDLYKICKYYYPDCTFEEVTNILYKEAFDKNYLRSSHCYMTNRRMFYITQYKEDGVIVNTGVKDEFGFVISDWKKILKL